MLISQRICDDKSASFKGDRALSSQSFTNSPSNRAVVSSTKLSIVQGRISIGALAGRGSGTKLSMSYTTIVVGNSIVVVQVQIEHKAHKHSQSNRLSSKLGEPGTQLTVLHFSFEDLARLLTVIGFSMNKH